jgi:hypothetical protein
VYIRTHNLLNHTKNKMKKTIFVAVLLLFVVNTTMQAQYSDSLKNTSTEIAHSILPIDGVIPYLPKDSSFNSENITINNDYAWFKPTANFFFRPEGTFNNYKGAGLPIDTGGLNFYLRGDFGARISFPKNIDMVFNMQSYGTYSRSLGPLDPKISLYEAYVEMKKLDRAGKLSLRFGRFSPGKYGNEILIGDDDFIQGRSFESLRFRYHTDRWTSDLMWIQLYQPAPDSVNFDWNHPIFLATLNTFHISSSINFDVNLPYIIDQYNSGYRTTVLMPDVRFFGHVGQIRYSAEYILQTGSTYAVDSDVKLGTVSANAIEVSAGYFSKNGKWSLDAAYYRGSGDDHPGDADIKSYNVLWQNEHRRFGYIDAFKGSNVTATTIHFDWKVGRLVSTGLHGVIANVIETKDRSTGVASGQIPEVNITVTDIGAGGDVYVNYFYNHNLNFQLSYSMFTPGEYFTLVNGFEPGGEDRLIEKTMGRLYLLMALKL